MGGGWGLGAKGKRSTNWQLQNSRGHVKYSIGNNTVITMDGARWVLDLSGEYLCKLCNCLTGMLCT